MTIRYTHGSIPAKDGSLLVSSFLLCQESGFSCSNLHSQLVGGERDVCMEEFRTGKNKVVIMR